MIDSFRNPGVPSTGVRVPAGIPFPAPTRPDFFRGVELGRVTLLEYLLYQVALHESGHVVAGRFFGLPVDDVTIDPQVAGPKNSGCAWVWHPEELPSLDQEDITAEMHAAAHVWAVVLAAGSEAEKLCLPDARPFVDDGYRGGDRQQAAAYAELVCNTMKSAKAFLDSARIDAARIMAAHRDQIAALADALIIERTLNGAAIDDILAGVSPTMRAERARRKEWAAMVANVERSGLQMTLRV